MRDRCANWRMLCVKALSWGLRNEGIAGRFERLRDKIAALQGQQPGKLCWSMDESNPQAAAVAPDRAAGNG